ncbi:MAG: hypothetical protein OWU33_15230 [Firmicutes bacterium]|nr:hypothetical protein [Bacillota bacterium]
MNPFAEWRAQHNLARREVALLARIDYAQVATTELGLVSRPHRALVRVVAAMDGDEVAETLENAYYTWREAQAHDLAEQLK